MRYRYFQVCTTFLAPSRRLFVRGPRRHAFVAVLLFATTLGGCVLAPRGLREERAKLDDSGSAYEPPFEQRALAEISAQPEWREILSRSFVVNGELEADYFEWKAALERVAIAAGYPNTNLAPSLSKMLSGNGMKSWDRTTLSVGFDSMQSLSFPSKIKKAGEVALEEARESGQRFLAAKFALQRQVLDSWLELALLEERARIQQGRVELATLASGSAEQRAAVVGDHRQLLRAQVEQREEQIELERFQAEVRAARAMLNALLAREAELSLDLGELLPEPRAIPVSDADLIAAGVANNPELQALASSVSARERALEFARLQYIPDFNPFVSFTGSVQQMIGVGVSLPTQLPQIRAGIREAGDLLSASRSRLRQMHLDRRSSFVAALTMLRFSELQGDFFEREVRPALEQVASSARQSYATGTASLFEMVGAEFALLDVRLSIAEARIEREKRLAELEQLGGFDVETLGDGANDARGDTEVKAHE